MVLGGALALSTLVGCVTKPYQAEVCARADLSGCFIEKVSVMDARKIAAGDVTEKISTVETGRAFGGALEHVPIFSIWDRLTVSYHRFDPFVLERDLARIERYYRARGYYEAHARAGRVQKLVDEGEVRVEIAVDEGEPVTIASVAVTWKDAGPLRIRVQMPVEEARQSLEKGAIFEESSFEETKKLLLRAMTDRGFAYAKVTGRSTIDLGTHKAQLVYELELGSYCHFGEIRIEGQGELPTKPLIAALGIKPEQEFSTAALEGAEIALTDFGIFGSVDVLPDLAAGVLHNGRVPVLFRVHPAALRAVKLGGGVEIGSRVEVHGLSGWENKNLFGGLRRFTVEGKPGVVFYPKSFDRLASSERVRPLFELKSHFELQQPAFLEPRTVGILGGSYNHFRQTTAIAAVDNSRGLFKLVTPDGHVVPYLQRLNTDSFVVGYNEVAGVAGVQRPFWRSRVNIALFARVQYESPFPYIADELPAGYKALIIPYAQTTASLDFRFDQAGKRTKLAPHSGLFASVDFQGAWGPDTQDLRLLPEIRGYIPLPRAITIALRLSAGFLFPFKTYFVDGCGAGASADVDGACGRALQIAQFRAFFSGGQSSNRGYAYNGVGPHEQVSSKSLELLPTGGNRLWEASAELRFPITGKFGSAVFVDASDVSRDVFRLSSPHLSAGIGLRYETPVGPFRADFGYRIPCMQLVGHCEPVYDPLAHAKPGFLPGDYLSPATGAAGAVFGLPIAVSVAIGEAF